MSETPVWQVGAWDLAADLGKIEQQWTAVREILEDPARYELGDPAISGWTCGQHAGHIVLAMRSIARGIEENLRNPERDRDRAWAGIAAQVLEGGGFPRGRAKAPDFLDPTLRSRDELLERLPQAEATWRALAGRREELAACPARFLHLAFGYLTSAEWVRFCAIHTAHHLSIVRELVEPGQIPGD